MAVMDATWNILEGLRKEGSFKWLRSSGRRSSFSEEFEEMVRSPSGRRQWVAELSPAANVVVGRCSQILNISTDELQQKFDKEALEPLRHPSCYARNFLEYCCFRALALSTQVLGHLGDKNFRHLTFDMMLAWEAPAISNEPMPKVDKQSTVGVDAFSRIAPAIPIAADVITCANIFDILTASTEGCLSFSAYEKYLAALDRVLKKMITQTESSHLSTLRLPREERILEIDGTLTTQPVLEHVGMSIWPGRLTLTDHSLYFEVLRVVIYDKPKVYDLADDLNQVIKSELTGPWGARLFDKAVMYKSTCLSEPVIIEFPELTGHSRRDYWLAMIREIFLAHEFIRKFQIDGVQRDETLSKAVLGILRLQAIHELSSAVLNGYDVPLMFNLANQLPGGDLILEKLADVMTLRGSPRAKDSITESGMYSLPAIGLLSNLGLVMNASNEAGLLVGDLVVGEMSSLEKVVKDAKSNFRKVEIAQETVDGAKVDGIDTNVAVMKELLYPMSELGKHLISLANWSDVTKSLVFCSVSSYVICRGWIVRAFALLLLLFAFFMLLTRLCNRGKLVEEVKVKAPPPMNTMEQLLAVQNAITHVEELVQDGNVILLKLRALLLSVVPQHLGNIMARHLVNIVIPCLSFLATERLAIALVLIALVIALLPMRLVVLIVFLEVFTRLSPPRRAGTEKLIRRLKEWWFSIPAAPVVLERDNEQKKRR